jgi:hypothetical protein
MTWLSCGILFMEWLSEDREINAIEGNLLLTVSQILTVWLFVTHGKHRDLLAVRRKAWNGPEPLLCFLGKEGVRQVKIG